jgi:hypothetical protein
MWHVYRLPGEFQNWELAIPLEEMKTEIAGAGIRMTDGFDAPARVRQFVKAWVDVQRAARNINWDGTFAMQPQAFPLLAFWGLCYGFVWKQKKFGITFVAAPFKLTYLDEHVDDDAQTDTEVVFRAKQAMSGIEPTAMRPALARSLASNPWGTSRNGNQYRTILGVVCTVFADMRQGGFKAVLSSDRTGRKIFTKSSPTEQEAMEYVDENFDDIWGTP